MVHCSIPCKQSEFLVSWTERANASWLPLLPLLPHKKKKKTIKERKKSWERRRDTQSLFPSPLFIDFLPQEQLKGDGEMTELPQLRICEPRDLACRNPREEPERSHKTNFPPTTTGIYDTFSMPKHTLFLAGKQKHPQTHPVIRGWSPTGGGAWQFMPTKSDMLWAYMCLSFHVFTGCFCRREKNKRKRRSWTWTHHLFSGTVSGLVSNGCEWCEVDVNANNLL